MPYAISRYTVRIKHYFCRRILGCPLPYIALTLISSLICKIGICMSRNAYVRQAYMYLFSEVNPHCVCSSEEKLGC